MVKKIFLIGAILTVGIHASWWDSNWHYRVPITIDSAVPNQTAKLNIDFTALGLSGDLDENSIRVVKATDTLLAKQEFTDGLYNASTDSLNNGKGEIKFLVEESGTVTYYVYYDVVENGSKTALSSGYAINGNFEHSNGSTPTGWTIGQDNIGTNAPNNEVHPTGGEGNTVMVNDSSVDNTAHTGKAFHVHGYRDRDESDSKKEHVYLEKTFTVPSSNFGTVDYFLKIQAFDDINYDYIVMSINGQAIDHTQLSISNSKITVQSDKYGKSQGYSTTVVDSGWTKASLSLASYSGNNITVRISHYFAGDNSYRSWELIDDFEWSINSSITLGSQETPPEAIMNISKRSCIITDPVNGTTNPKRIPGGTIRYAIEVSNSGSSDATDVTTTDNISSIFDEDTINNIQIQSGVCDCLGVTSISNNGVNGTTNGINPIILDFGDVLKGSVATPTIECGYFEVKLK